MDTTFLTENESPSALKRLRAWRSETSFWPLARLLVVLAVFGAIARFQFGVMLGQGVRNLPIATGEVLAAAFFVSLIARPLGQWLVWFALLPVWFFVFGNDWFYRAALWPLRNLSSKHPRVIAAVAFAGELALFLAAFYGARALGLHYGLRL